MTLLSSRAARRVIIMVLALLTQPAAMPAQAHITSPKEQFGFNIGDDWKLANYTQFEAYWRRLATESKRMKLVEIGKSAEGRSQLMAIISSPANLARLDRYRDISARLSHAEGLTDAQAHELAREGRTVVWIDGGLHATEVLGAAQLIQSVYELTSRNDPETLRILNDCIILAVHVNPDGMELVSDWYMKEADTLKRNMNIPRLYEKYAGHDDNRDFYMSNLPETRNVNHVQYWEWFPQIVYNHHQTGPAGTVMFAPPFRDPFNYNYDPLVIDELDLVAASMHSRFEAENKPGVTSRSGSTYSTWWNGGLRTTPYFHNMVGLLTETIGSPTPTAIPFIPDQQLPRADLPYPIAPQPWHFRQSIDYSITANWAVLDIASRERENLLYNSYRMGRNAIERGSRDSWTASPSRIDSVKRAVERDQPATARGAGSGAGGGAVGDPIFQFGRGVDAKYYSQVLHAPATRDARGYVIPADQPDFATATKFVNTLRHVGVTVLQATSDFTVQGRRYPAKSFVVKTAQAYRPMVLDMFEPQDHPNDVAYPGGPPKRPYDNAGYTLAFQMGVKFDRVLEGFDGPFQPVRGLAPPLAATVATTGARGYLISHAVNDAFVAVNRALGSGATVLMLRTPMTANGVTYPAGSFYLPATGTTTPMVQKLARSIGLAAAPVTMAPATDAIPLRARRIALYDQYGGSMPSGWTRYIFEQFGFAYDVVYPQQIDAGLLDGKYDVLILPSGAAPQRPGQGRGFFDNTDSSAVPAEYRSHLGRLTVAKSVPAIRRFLEQGGTVIAVGTSSNIGAQLGLPITSALTETTAQGTVRDLPAEKFYVPGSVLRVQVDTTRPVSFGLPRDLDVFYDNSPAFRLGADAAARGVRPLAWFANGTPLRSGWAWGQSYLDGAVVAAQATVGKGSLYLFAPEITFRAQPHGTFKWLFNAIVGGPE